MPAPRISVAYLADLIVVTLSGTPFPDLERALPLLLGTGATESAFQHLKQQGGGTARGLFQMENVTAKDHWTWLKRNPRFLEAVTTRTLLTAYNEADLTRNIPLQILLARTHYYVRSPQRLPEAQDLQGAAAYYKTVYNTAGGKGSTAKYLRDWQALVEPYWGSIAIPSGEEI